MRHDMRRVIITPGRHGSKNRGKKTRKRLDVRRFNDEWDDIDTGPQRAPVGANRQHGWDAKEFSDLLTPLWRFLHKNVGRPWDKVWSEMCEHSDPRSVDGWHFRLHVDVETSTYMKDGKVMENPRFGHPREANGFYVHPVNGLLCYKREWWR